VGYIPNYELDLPRVFAERMASVEHFEEREAYLTPGRLAFIEKYNGPQGIERIHGTLQTIEKGDWPRHWVDIDFLLRLVRELYDAGVVLVPGTDSGGSFLISGLGLHEELRLFEKAGLSPYQVLRTATVNAAEVLGLGGRKGTVEIGKDADLILVRDNPLEALASVRTPIGLVVHGHWLGEEELELLRSRTFHDES
jgi:imidazolonepropionase-like amidohydrolase